MSKYIIDIPEEMHEQIKDGYVPLGISKYLKNGTPYEERPHGSWVDVPKYKGYYVCSKCLERLDCDFTRFDHWEMKKENFCSVCGSDNRKRGETDE